MLKTDPVTPPDGGTDGDGGVPPMPKPDEKKPDEKKPDETSPDKTPDTDNSKETDSKTVLDSALHVSTILGVTSAAYTLLF